MKREAEEMRYAALAAKALRDDLASTPRPALLGDRAAALAAIEQALRSRARRRVRPWIAAGAAAAAAVALAVLSLSPGHHLGAPATVAPVDPASRLAVEAVDGEGATAIAGAAVVAGTRVHGPVSGSLVLRSGTGTRLRVGAASDLRVVALGATQTFLLESGRVRAEVAKLHAGARFIITTADAEVEVRGTKFEVAIAPEPDASGCGLPIRTRVAVDEGVVVVRAGGREARVAAGESWPACAPPRPSAAAAVAPPEARPAPRDSAPSRSSAPARTSAPARHRPAKALSVSSSTLAEQNDLFAAALSAARRGDTREALYWLDRLLERYAEGPMAGSARAQRQRLQGGGAGAAAPSP